MNRINALRKVITHNITRLDSTLDYDRVTDAIILLANTLVNSETDENTWYLGEYEDFCLADLIVGAYWHYTDWHGGQSSKGYQALSALGQVFDSGMSSLEDGAPESYVYEMLEQLETQ